MLQCVTIHVCHGQKVAILGMVIPPLIGILLMGIYTPTIGLMTIPSLPMARWPRSPSQARLLDCHRLQLWRKWRSIHGPIASLFPDLNKATGNSNTPGLMMNTFPYPPWDWYTYLPIEHKKSTKFREICHTWMVWASECVSLSRPTYPIRKITDSKSLAKLLRHTTPHSRFTGRKPGFSSRFFHFPQINWWKTWHKNHQKSVSCILT